MVEPADLAGTMKALLPYAKRSSNQQTSYAPGIKPARALQQAREQGREAKETEKPDDVGHSR